MPTPAAAAFEMFDDLLESLGGISPSRIRLRPAPGTATVKDVVRIRDRERRLFELVDGTLVEKVMGLKESLIAMYLGHLLLTFIEKHGNPGVVFGEAGTLRLLGGLVRVPDVSYTLRARLPNGKVPSEPIPDLVPDLAVEILSRKNTRREMQRKLKEYFLAGVRLVWYIDPRTRTARSYTSPDDMTELGPADSLHGGVVLPGLRVPLAQVFADLADEPAVKKPKKRK